MTPAALSVSQRLRDDWPLWLVLAVAAAVRLLFLDSMELWWDEFVTLGRSLPPVPQLLSGLMYQSPAPVSTDCSPPLHHLLVHAALHFGRDGSIIRLPSVVFGCLGLACVMGLARRVGGLRPAVVAGLFCALSLFHVYYSRDIRWYAVYYGVSLGAAWLLLLATVEDRPWQWAACGAAMGASLYASYVAAPALAGLGAYVAGLTALRLRSGDRAGAWRLLRRAGLAFALALLLYAPWLPAQYYAFHSFYGTGTANPLDWGQMARNFRFFLEYFYQGGFDRLLFAAPLAVLGWVLALAGPGRAGAWLVLAWGLPPLAAAYLVRTEFSVSPKYVMSGFFLLALGLGFGAEAAGRLAARLAGRAGPGIARAAGWTAALACLFLAGASNLHFPAFYQGKTYSDKGALRRVALDKNNVDAVFYEDERNYSFVGDWYLGDLYRRATGRFGRGYKRYWFLSPGRLHPPGTVPAFSDRPFDASLGAVVNRAPLPVLPDASGGWRYADGYRDLRLFSEAFATDNVTVNLTEGGLAPADMSRPGTALYAFSLDEGAEVVRARLRLSALCLKRNVFFPDAAVTVRAGGDPARLVPLGRLDAHSPPGPPRPDAGYRGAYQVAGEWEIPQEELSGAVLYVALTVSDGTREGAVKAASFSLDCDCRGQGPEPVQAMRREWARVLGNLGQPARPSGGAAVVPGRLAAFSRDPAIFPPDPAAGLGSPAEAEAFLAAHPGLAPVYAVRDPDGRAVLELYDPWLLDPYLHLPPAGSPPLAVALDQPAVGYKARGAMRPSLAVLAGQPLPLSQGLPGQATVTHARTGESFILVRELFDEAHFAPEDLFATRDARVRPEAAVMTCLGASPCQATYRLASLYPMTRLTLTTFPRVFGDPAGDNALRLAVAVGDGPFEEVYSLKSDRSGLWSDTDGHPRVDAVPLPKGTTEARVRLEMATDGSLFHSSPEAAMTFEAGLDARAMPPVAATSGELANGAPEAGPAAVQFLRQPPSAFEKLRPGLAVTPWMRPFFR